MKLRQNSAMSNSNVLGDVELERAARAGVYGELEEVGEMVVDLPDERFGREGVGHAPAQHAAVGSADEQDRIGGQPVAPGTAGFLEVGFDGIGGVEVDDGADVGLVDAHAECVCGDDDTRLAVLPGALAQVLVERGEACVVVLGADALLVEPSRRVVGVLPRAGVDDGRAGYGFEDAQERSLLVVCVAHDVGEVRPGETHADGVLPAEAEALLYVVDDGGGGGGCQGQHGTPGQQAAHGGDVEVGRAEVVAPLRDAVCLVDGDEADGHLPKRQLSSRLAISSCVRPVWMAVALMPRRRRASTWSFIRAMRGVMTRQTPSVAMAGTWKVMLFPPPVGMSPRVSRPSPMLRMMSSWTPRKLS